MDVGAMSDKACERCLKNIRGWNPAQVMKQRRHDLATWLVCRMFIQETFRKDAIDHQPQA